MLESDKEFFISYVMEAQQDFKIESMRLFRNSITIKTQTSEEPPIKLWPLMKEQENGIFYDYELIERHSSIHT